MPYAHFDDRYDDHRKTKRAWRVAPAAVGLHAMAITYCNRHQTDGKVDAEWVEERLILSPLKSRERQAVLDTLLDVGMFERDGDDYRVHDFLDWNRSRAQRQALAEQGRRGGQAKAAAKGKRPDGDDSGPGSSRGYSNGHSEGSSEGSSTPLHATPTPRHATPSQESANADSVAAAPPPDDDLGPVDQVVDDLCHLMSHHIRTAHGIDPRSKEARVTKGWRSACRGLLTLDVDPETDEHYTREQVAYAIEWVCRHHYWSRRIKSMTRLRSEMAQVAKDIREQRDRTNVVQMRGRRESAGSLLRAINGEAS